MVQVLKIEKTGDIKYIKITDTNELYKKCGFRKDIGFEKITNWEKTINGDIMNIELWGRTSGKNNIKNNYKFPKPFNQNIYGNCSLIYKQNDITLDLTEELWNKMHIVDETDISMKDIQNNHQSNHHEDTNDDSNDDSNEYQNDNDDDDNDDLDILSISEDDNSELEEESYIYSDEEDNKS